MKNKIIYVKWLNFNMILAFEEKNDRSEIAYSISKEVNLNVFPSNNPLSDNFKEGITKRAIKDKLI